MKFLFLIKNEEANSYYDGSNLFEEKICMYKHFSNSIYDAYQFESKEEALNCLKNKFSSFHNLTIIEIIGKG